ncbi:hypothetical protein IT568_06760, partial [bacterium]|nr:hypothetical protein [bacterium]
MKTQKATSKAMFFSALILLLSFFGCGEDKIIGDTNSSQSTVKTATLAGPPKVSQTDSLNVSISNPGDGYYTMTIVNGGVQGNQITAKIPYTIVTSDDKAFPVANIKVITSEQLKDKVATFVSTSFINVQNKGEIGEVGIQIEATDSKGNKATSEVVKLRFIEHQATDFSLNLNRLNTVALDSVSVPLVDGTTSTNATLVGSLSKSSEKFSFELKALYDDAGTLKPIKSAKVKVQMFKKVGTSEVLLEDFDNSDFKYLSDGTIYKSFVRSITRQDENGRPVYEGFFRIIHKTAKQPEGLTKDYAYYITDTDVKVSIIGANNGTIATPTETLSDKRVAFIAKSGYLDGKNAPGVAINFSATILSTGANAGNFYDQETGGTVQNSATTGSNGQTAYRYYDPSTVFTSVTDKDTAIVQILTKFNEEVSDTAYVRVVKRKFNLDITSPTGTTSAAPLRIVEGNRVASSAKASYSSTQVVSGTNVTFHATLRGGDDTEVGKFYTDATGTTQIPGNIKTTTSNGGTGFLYFDATDLFVDQNLPGDSVVVELWMNSGNVNSDTAYVNVIKKSSLAGKVTTVDFSGPYADDLNTLTPIAQLETFGESYIFVKLTDINGNPVDGKAVNFTTSLGRVEPANILSGSVTVGNLTYQGAARVKFIALQQAGNAVIKASVSQAAGGTLEDSISTQIVSNNNPASIELKVSANELQVKGTGGLETITVQATVKDAGGLPVSEGKNIKFSFDYVPNPTDALIDQPTLFVVGQTHHYNETGIQVTTNNAGLAQVQMTSGNKNGPVAVRACWTDNCGTVFSTYSAIVITSGPPDKIFVGYNKIGQDIGGGLWKTEPSASVVDKFGNPVRDSTAVFFTI